MNTSKKGKPPVAAKITNEERDLVFWISDGRPDLIKQIGWIRMLAQDVKDVEYMDLLRWLKRNQVRGMRFHELISIQCEGSVLQAIAFIRMKVHSDFGIKKIFAKPL